MSVLHVENKGYKCSVVGCTRNARCKKYCRMHYEHYLKYKEISMKRPKSLSLSHEDVRIAMAKNSALYEENFKEMKLYVGTPQIKKYLLKEKILNRNDIRLRKLLKHF